MPMAPEASGGSVMQTMGRAAIPRPPRLRPTRLISTGLCFALLMLGLVALAFAAPAAELRVPITEYDVPTPNSRPHDPARGPDGSLWYTGQAANKLGRLDPRTGEIREYPLRKPDSGPHGIAADKAGNIWFTANSAGYIGKFDPKTSEMKEYPLPDPKARDPHTPVFDANGIL